MKLTKLEIIGTILIILGLSVSPDHGNAGTNLLATIVCLSLGASCFVVNKKKHILKGRLIMEQNYIIRADRAGVFYGQIKERNGSEVTMTNVRRLWYWNGAASISQLATEGTKNPRECKFTVVVPEMTILGVIEIIPCGKGASKIIEEVPVWKR